MTRIAKIAKIIQDSDHKIILILSDEDGENISRWELDEHVNRSLALDAVNIGLKTSLD